MGLKESFTGCSILTKVCLVLLFLAQICSWVAFTVPEWAKTYDLKDWFVAVQAMSVLGFAGINIAFIVLLLQVFTSRCKSVSDIGLGNAILCIVTAILYLIGAIIFGVKFDGGFYGAPIPAGQQVVHASDLGFGFGLAIVAALLEVVTGVLMIVDNRKSTRTSPA